MLLGDDLYPKEPDIYGTEPMPEIDAAIDDLRPPGSKLNRVEIKDRSNIVVKCNVEDPTGHKSLQSEHVESLGSTTWY